MITINKELCSGCAICLDACPIGVLEIKDSKAIVIDGCIECDLCIPSCPVDIITKVTNIDKQEVTEVSELNGVKEETEGKTGDLNGSEINSSDSRV